MLKLNFVLALRNLLKSRLYSIVNITGLSIGFMAFLSIILFVKDETSYDDFHAKSDRIYRLKNQSNGRSLAITPPIWSRFLKEEIAAVENTVTLQPISTVVIKDNKPFAETRAFAIDSSFFKIFDFPVVSGSSQGITFGPTSLVISSAMARKYFADKDPVGQIMELDLFGGKESFVVEAVLECPRTSHLQFDFLIPYEPVKRHFHNVSYYEHWRVQFVYTYLLMKGEVNPEQLAVEFKAFLMRHGGEQLKNRFTPEVEALESIYLESELLYDTTPRGNISHVRTLTIAAVALLIIAMANFVNLTTAQSLRRAKEVGLRKVFGSRRKGLIIQFLTESTLLAMVSMLLAMGLWFAALPYYNDLTEKYFNMSALFTSGILWILVLLPLVAGTLAGLYPALIISGFKPLAVLRSRAAHKSQGRLARKILVIFQFSVAVILLISTSVVYRQVNFMLDADLGFSADQVVVVNDNGVISADAVKRERLRSELANRNDVVSMSASSSYPGSSIGSTGYVPQGFDPSQSLSIMSFFVDFDFIKTYDIEIVQGRALNKNLASDSSAFLINQAAQKLFATKDPLWLSEPLGMEINHPPTQRKGPVVGVFKDFNFQSLHSEVNPLVIMLHPTRIFVLQIRLKTANLDNTLQSVEDLWLDLFPETPFDYQFVDQSFAEQYGAEKKLGELFMLFGVFSIFIAVLGLFSLASFLTQERARELSVRKVFGAGTMTLFLMLTKKFNVYVLIANVIGIPLAFWLMHLWLNEFAYRVDMSFGLFLSVFLVTLVVALLATAYHTFKSVTLNPAEVLAQE